MAASTTYADRLRDAMGITPRTPADEARRRFTALAARIGVTYQAIAKFERGTSNAMSAPNNARAARELGVDSDWLALGVGEMRTGRVWPFGLEVTPVDWALLGSETRQNAIDLVRAAVDRMHRKLGEARG